MNRFVIYLLSCSSLLVSSCMTDPYGNTKVDGQTVAMGVGVAAVAAAAVAISHDNNKYNNNYYHHHRHCPPPRHHHHKAARRCR